MQQKDYRLHGSEELYRSGYDGTALGRWAARCRHGHRAIRCATATLPVRHLAAPRAARRDVFVYFDNTDKRRAPDDAQTLMRKIAATLAERTR
jgi:uncharacterized protein YecE (DUF72 family)